MDVRCQVIAPSLIPKAPGDKARDRPAGLPAAGAAAPGWRTGRERPIKQIGPADIRRWQAQLATSTGHATLMQMPVAGPADPAVRRG